MAQQYDDYGYPTFGGDPYEDRRNSVAQWYRQYLGREGGADEIQGWAQNANFGSVENAIRDSEEGRAYASRSAQPSATSQPSPAQQWNREQFRDAWLGTGTDVARQNELLGQYGITLDAAGRGRLPSNDLLDLRYGAKAGINRATWTAVNDPSTPGFENYASQQQPAASSADSGGSAGLSDPRADQLFNMLLGRAQQGLAIDRNDPRIRAQSDAYAANAERSRRNYLADLAEQEGPIANLRGEQRLSAERMGQATGAFEAELLGRELTARREEIAQALASMQGLLTTDQQLTLQRELALIDDATRRLQIDQQGQQFGQQLAYNYESLDNALLRQLLGGIGA